MGEKGFISANWFKLCIVTILVAIIGLYIYREYQLDKCINSVEEGFQKQMDEICIKSKLKPGCNSSDNFVQLLNGDSIFAVTGLGHRREAETNYCFRRYSFK
ncbi:MAG: hypothetical protein RL744_2 [Pseudomonadota bacterium]